MRTRRSREETTLQIGAALLVFLGVVVLGGALLVATHLWTPVPSGLVDTLAEVLPFGAAAVAVTHLVRLGRRERSAPPATGVTPDSGRNAR